MTTSLRALIAAGLVATVSVVACGSGDAPPPASLGGSVADPAEAPMRRLMAPQYVASVEVLFGPEAAEAADPPPDSELNGYSAIAATQLSMTDGLVKDYEASARAVAAAAMSDSDRIAELRGCEPEGPSDRACMESFVSRTGRLAFRRPLTDEEVADFTDVGMKAAGQLDSFDAGVEYVITSLLQAPSFLFMVETGEPIEGQPGKSRLTAYELATRMSFFLVGATPNEALLDAAEAGELDTAEGRRQTAMLLVADPRAREALAEFFEEYLVLEDLPTTPKDPNLFPGYSPELAASMQEETQRLLEHLVWEKDADIRQMLTAELTFVDGALADHYGVAPPEEGWKKVELPDEQGRSGVLSHPSIMTRQAHSTATSVTYRGLFVLERFLCQSMPPPPDDVVSELPPSSAAPTMRQRLEVHLKEERCAGCHELSDTIGLALENYDPVGKWRKKENGVVIDATADHPFLGSFEGAQGLGQALSREEKVTRCILRNLFRHGTGHVETEGELDALDGVHGRFADDGYRMQALLIHLVTSDVFRTIATPKKEAS